MKKFISYFFKTLYKNDAVVDAGRTQPWWQGIILFFISIFISIIPTLCTTWTVDGSTFLGSNTYGVDDGLVAFSKFLSDKNMNFDIDHDAKQINVSGQIVSLSTWNEALGASKDSKTPAPYKYNIYVIDSSTSVGSEYYQKTVFEAYDFTDYTNKDLVAININNILQNRSLLPYDTTDYTVTKISSTDVVKTTSFLIFTKDSYALYKFPNASTTYTSASGNFNNLSTSSFKDIKDLASWKEFFRQGYIDNKNYVCAMQTSIILAVNVAITLLMGFMLWIMTRGKNNPFRVIKFHETMEMGFWASFSPAVLSLIFGFLMSQFATIAYVMIYGVRVMFISMKQLKPAFGEK
jgi:maltodextrin utilization protein YvdJ